MPLAVDPQFAVFDRGFNQQASEAAGEAARRRDAIQRAHIRSMPGFDAQEEKGLQGVHDDFGARGVFSSGVRVQRQNEVSRDAQRGRSNASAEAADALSGVDWEMSKQIAAVRRKQAEAALEAQQKSALTPIQNWASAYLGG